MIIRATHFRKCGICSKGLRNFFKRYSLDYSDFIKNGITEDALAATNDAQAINAINKIKEVYNGLG